VVALLEEKGRQLSAEDLAELRRRIEEAAKQGR
jgi:hypothetical protein